MTSETLTLASSKPASAEDQAAVLTHMQLLDIVFVHRNGRMQISAHTAPWRPTQRLIDLDILKPSAVPATGFRYLVPGHRFRPVLEALWRSGRVARPAEVVL